MHEPSSSNRRRLFVAAVVTCALLLGPARVAYGAAPADAIVVAEAVAVSTFGNDWTSVGPVTPPAGGYTLHVWGRADGSTVDSGPCWINARPIEFGPGDAWSTDWPLSGQTYGDEAGGGTLTYGPLHSDGPLRVDVQLATCDSATAPAYDVTVWLTPVDSGGGGAVDLDPLRQEVMYGNAGVWFALGFGALLALARFFYGFAGIGRR
jgi:hypothetical protein